MVKIAVCEDELELLIQLTSYVKTILEKHSISHHIESFTSTGALFAREAFDILLLDIEMAPLSDSAGRQKQHHLYHRPS